MAERLIFSKTHNLYKNAGVYVNTIASFLNLKGHCGTSLKFTIASATISKLFDIVALAIVAKYSSNVSSRLVHTAR